VVPGQELTGCEQPFAASGWRNNKQIAKFLPRFCWTHTHSVSAFPGAKKQTIRNDAGRKKLTQLIRGGKTRFMQAVVMRYESDYPVYHHAEKLKYSLDN